MKTKKSPEEIKKGILERCERFRKGLQRTGRERDVVLLLMDVENYLCGEDDAKGYEEEKEPIPSTNPVPTASKKGGKYP